MTDVLLDIFILNDLIKIVFLIFDHIERLKKGLKLLKVVYFKQNIKIYSKKVLHIIPTHYLINEAVVLIVIIDEIY